MKITAFGASNSATSINKQLAAYAARLFANADTEILDLRDYDLPTYSPQRQAEGFPQQVQDFYNKMQSPDVDLIIISHPSHNGSYTAAYKSLFDWASRINAKVYAGKKLLVLGTSPGPGGAKNVAEMFAQSAPFFGATVVGTFSLPSFHQNFKDGIIIHAELDAELREIVAGIHLQAGNPTPEKQWDV